MKYLVFFICLSGIMSAQQTPEVSKADIKQDIYFLASDELQGRKTGEPGNLVAARYIAENFRKLGLQSPDGIDDYFQNIPFEKRVPANEGKLVAMTSTLIHGLDMIILAGKESNFTSEIVFVEQAWVDDTIDQFNGIDITDKLVLSLFGKPGSQDSREGFAAIREKRKNVKDRGGKGLIEVYTGGFPWTMIKRFMNTEQITIADEPEGGENNDIYILTDYNFRKEIDELNSGKPVSLTINNSGVDKTLVYSPNVVAYLPGSDPNKREEYIVVSAHYDHIGTNIGGAGDIIFNGARDNAIGTAALLSAAKYFAKHPPKRSLLFIAFTGEEIGLLGSSYYVDHPALPLNKAIFNMNTDGAGYNDTTLITIIGHDRVGVFDIFKNAASKQGLKAIGDPFPEQNLFDRSDNVSFAKMGIPAPNFSPGITAFDQEIMKYYHQTADNPETLNYRYLHKFVQAFIDATKQIANLPEQPRWTVGDKYEGAYKKLYGEK